MIYAVWHGDCQNDGVIPEFFKEERNNETLFNDFDDDGYFCGDHPDDVHEC